MKQNPHIIKYQSPAKKEFKRFLLNFTIGLLFALAFCVGQAMTTNFVGGKLI